MAGYEILDLYPAFRSFWARARRWPVSQQIEAFGQDYLGPWPELLRKQTSSYREEGVDWKKVARRRIFPWFDRRIPEMARARNALLRSIPLAVQRCREELGLRFPVTFVIHVGLGCGAGWATTFEERPAVLLGLENAAELGWTDRVTTAALVEHEIAHLLHDTWRRKAGRGGLTGHRGPWWQLYEEGFATYCELRLGPPGKHHSGVRTRDWLSWCRRNRPRLAALFLRGSSSPESVRRFFGSWNNVEGYIETGYFLGSEVIREWVARSSLQDIATWIPSRIRRRAQSSLRRMASSRDL